MARTHQAYPQEYRQQMVELIHAGRTPEDLAQEFEPSAGSIRNWVAQDERDAGQRSDGLSGEERQELRRLRRENKQLRIERDILKKQRLGSHGRATRSRSGIPVREGESGHVAGAHPLPSAGSLPQRLLRMGAPQAVGASAAGRAVDGAHQGGLDRQPRGVRPAADTRGVAGSRRTGQREAGRATDAARRDRGGEPPAYDAHDYARAASGAGSPRLGRAELSRRPRRIGCGWPISPM